MGKLKAVTSRIGKVKPRLGYVQGDQKAQARSREAFSAWRAWYRTPKWAKLRGEVLLRDRYTCRMCGRTASSPDLVADHIVPHRGDPTMFWCGPEGIQTLCASCHSKHKQRSERAER